MKMPALIVGLTLVTVSAFGAESPGQSSCLVQPDKSVAIKATTGRTIYCGLDLGSRTVKLSVLSMEKGRIQSIRDERQCKRTLGLGAQAFDSTSNTRHMLPDAAIADLVETIREYQRICTLDGGTLVAAGATQWARDATNVSLSLNKWMSSAMPSLSSSW